MANWTTEQLQAIEARNHTILVSAAAGSGKTTVLIERIVRLLREGFRMDRMLIVTFTRAAAAEMRERLQKRILHEAQVDPQVMGPALDQLEQAEISTIHRFCQRALRDDFQAIGIDPLATICEEQQRRILFEQAYHQAMNELLEDEAQADFQFLACQVDQKEICAWNERLYAFLMSMPHPFSWLQHHADHLCDQPYTDQPWFVPLRKQAGQQLGGIDEILIAERQMLDQPEALTGHMVNWEADMAVHNAFLKKLADHPEELPVLIGTYSLPKLKSVKVPGGKSPAEEEWEKEYKRQREKHKKLVKEIAAALSPNQAVLDHDFPVVQRLLKGMMALAERTHQCFLALKKDANCLDFHDLEQMTLEILENPDLRERIQQSYDHIFVDECQDVSAIQDAILQSVHGPDSCLFMVGDVKQSIYRFRLADPTLFLHRMRTFSRAEDASERAIFLQRNFRSTNNILDATNRVFRKTMKADVTELDYLPEDELIPSMPHAAEPPVYVEILDRGEDGMRSADWLRAQAEHSAKIIRALLQEQYLSNGSPAQYTYRDIVILMPAVSTHGSEVADILQAHGIPVYFDGSDDYFALPEILAVRALLDVLDNPLQDVPLLSVLKMTPFLMTDGDLADIRICKMGRDVPFYEAFETCCEEETSLAERCRIIRQKLNDWRFQSQVARLPDFLWMILRETGLYASAGALPDGELRQANLTLLCQKAADYESQGRTSLHGFIQMMESIHAAGDMTSAKILGEDENLVRIMTMHKSKGLEFPAVILIGLEDDLHKHAAKGIQLSSGLGVCVPYYNRDLNVSRETILNQALGLQTKLDEKAERARLLYVAMTRAKQRLYLVGGMDGKPDISWKLRDSAYRVSEAKCMFDWIMQSVLDDVGSIENGVKQAAENLLTDSSTSYPQPVNPWSIRVTSLLKDQTVENYTGINDLWNMLQNVIALPENSVLNAAWEQLKKVRTGKPLKTSVSAMLRQIEDPLPVLEMEETALEKAMPYVSPTQLRLSDAARMPQFMMAQTQMSGAEHGTLVHRALSLMPLEPLRCGSYAEGVQQGLIHLQQMGCLSAEEAAVIRPNMLLGFYQSELGQRMLRSPVIRREWSFTIPLRDSGTLMQGVIDCAFRENDGWILIDYKTDRIDDEAAFIARYERQLALYADAIFHITGAPVHEQHLYSLRLGKSFRVNDDTL